VVGSFGQPDEIDRDDEHIGREGYINYWCHTLTYTYRDQGTMFYFEWCDDECFCRTTSHSIGL
jgi:hypothetical protein